MVFVYSNENFEIFHIARMGYGDDQFRSRAVRDVFSPLEN